MLLVKGICSTEVPHTVADSDRQIRGWGGGVGGHPDPEIRGAVSKKIFWPLGPQFGLKIRGGAVIQTLR